MTRLLVAHNTSSRVTDVQLFLLKNHIIVLISPSIHISPISLLFYNLIHFKIFWYLLERKSFRNTCCLEWNSRFTVGSFARDVQHLDWGSRPFMPLHANEILWKSGVIGDTRHLWTTPVPAIWNQKNCHVLSSSKYPSHNMLYYNNIKRHSLYLNNVL